MPSLSSNNLAIMKRPGDGACGLWSCGTGVGHYNAGSFDLFGDGSMRSPIQYPDEPLSNGLLTQMRADRGAIYDWLADEANYFTLRAEYELWTNPAAMKHWFTTRCWEIHVSTHDLGFTLVG